MQQLQSTSRLEAAEVLTEGPQAHAGTGGLAQVWSQGGLRGGAPACLGAALVPTAAAATASCHAICDRCACAATCHCGMGPMDCRARAFPDRDMGVEGAAVRQAAGIRRG